MRLYALTGSRDYCLLPCHSQIPREDQRKVFAPVPEGVTKVQNVLGTRSSLIADQMAEGLGLS